MAVVHRETTCAADDTFELPALTELVAEIDRGALADPATPIAEGEVTQQLRATYPDTADLRLAGAGLTLRRRTGGDDEGWHLKVPAGVGARSEVRLPLARATRTVPEALQQMVWARSKGAALRPVAEISTERTVHRLVDATGRVLVEVADDRVTARKLLPLNGAGDAAGAALSWREIEVELADGGEELLDAVDSRLREHGLQVAPSASKLAHVLGVTRGDGRHPNTGKKLTAKSSAGKALPRLVARS
jgi:inorganic triphosphatase YgiF